MKTHVLILGAVLTVAATSAGPATATFSDEDLELRDQIHRLVREIGFLRVASSLQLSRDQASSLLPLASRAREIADQHAMIRREYLEEQKAAFAAFKAEDMRDQGFSPEVEKRTGEANHRGEEAEKRQMGYALEGTG